MKAIMYHYVQKYDLSLPFFRFLDLDNFRRQLDFFAENFGFVERDEWCEFIEYGKPPKTSGKVILTFDDSLRSHYEYVFPELMYRNLWGFFFIPTAPYHDNLILDVHRIHLLCGAYPGDQLLEIANNLITNEMVPNEKIYEFQTQTYRRQKNSLGVSEFKRLLNYYVQEEHRSKIITDIATFINYKFNITDFYVPISDLFEMKKQGMIIGSHSHTHPVMSKLDLKLQNDEIEKSYKVLQKLIDPNHMTYCHPYGGFHSFNDDTISLLEKKGVKYAFNVDGREINNADLLKSLFYLPRFDCNMFPNGHVS